MHKKVLGRALSRKLENLSTQRLLLLLSFVIALLHEKKHLTKEQRKSLAITESQLGIRSQTLKEEGELKRGRKKRTRSRKKAHKTRR